MPKPMPLLATLAALSLAGPAQAAFDLVSASEVMQDRQAPDSPRMRAVPTPGAPAIELLSPAAGKPLPSPMDIKLRWTASGGAAIDTSSVRVRYGRLGIDVTSRVLGAAQVTPTGIDAPGAKLPAGEHRLTVEVADSQQRLGRQDFVVVILDK